MLHSPQFAGARAAVLGGLFCLACLVASPLIADTAVEDGQVAIGRTISIQYTLKLKDGTEFESNLGKGPLVFEHGAGQIITGLDEAMVGMRQGESKTVTIEAAKGFGPVDRESFLEVPLQALPEDARKVGASVAAHDGAGGEAIYRVVSIEGDKASLDANHALAGETLIYEFKILNVE
jgi:peptidylprolyl isomerase